MHTVMEAFLQGRVKKTNATEKPTSSKNATTAEKKSILWVEKYRPRRVDDVVFQDEVVGVLKKCLKGADLPNLLFYGPPGTGKTSAILAVARELYGPELFRSRILELNASDERGIQVIREKVKNFAQLAVSSTRPDGSPCPPFKLIILDEADSMTSSAQAALRRTMEKESKTTRFCLICNYVSRIIEPLTSRCSKFRFKPLSLETLRCRLEHICSKEGVTCDGEVMESIVSASEGDLRKAITFLQSAHQLRGGDGIRKDDVVEIAGLVPQDYIHSLIKACYSNMYDRLDSNVQDLIADGYSATQIISQLHDVVVEHEKFTDRQKSIICERIALADKRLSDGADEYLQVLDLCTVIMTQLCKATPT